MGTAGERADVPTADVVLFWLFTVSKRPRAGFVVVAMPGMMPFVADVEDVADGVPGREAGINAAESG